MTWAERSFTPFEIDLVSDNACRPTAAMREFMCSAAVGDEERSEDPTVRELEQLVAELTGKPSAVFMPSGTMCNVVAFNVWCEPGDALLLHEDTHPVYSKYAGPHIHNRLELHRLVGERGVLSADTIARALDAPREGAARPRLLSLENTHNRTGGSVWSLAELEEAASAARERGLAVHIDGARLLNAVAAVMAGDEEFVTRARQTKYLFGGVTHKAGMMAAAGVYALRHHVERLSEDHARARKLAAGLEELEGIELAQRRVETNIVYFDLAASDLNASQVLEGLAQAGVRMKQIGPTRLRAVTHLEITGADIATAVAAVASTLAR